MAEVYGARRLQNSVWTLTAAFQDLCGSRWLHTFNPLTFSHNQSSPVASCSTSRFSRHDAISVQRLGRSESVPAGCTRRGRAVTARPAVSSPAAIRIPQPRYSSDCWMHERRTISLPALGLGRGILHRFFGCCSLVIAVPALAFICREIS